MSDYQYEIIADQQLANLALWQARRWAEELGETDDQKFLNDKAGLILIKWKLGGVEGIDVSLKRKSLPGLP